MRIERLIDIPFGILIILVLIVVGISLFQYINNPYSERCSKITDFGEKIMLVQHEDAISNLTLRIEKLEGKVK